MALTKIKIINDKSRNPPSQSNALIKSLKSQIRILEAKNEMLQDQLMANKKSSHGKKEELRQKRYQQFRPPVNERPAVVACRAFVKAAFWSKEDDGWFVNTRSISLLPDSSKQELIHLLNQTGQWMPRDLGIKFTPLKNPQPLA